MKAWEMVHYLEISWNQILVQQKVDVVTKSVIRVIKDQNTHERERAATIICGKDSYSDEFREHSLRLLGIEKNFQRRMF